MANKGVAKYLSLDFHAMDVAIEKYKKLGVDLKPIVTEILKDTHEDVTQRLIDATVKSNYPAHGQYSQGDTAESIKRDASVYWVDPTSAFVPVGYDLQKSKNSIFLMYGTPRMPKVSKMYDAIFGRKTRTQIRQMQEESFKELCEDALNRG